MKNQLQTKLQRSRFLKLVRHLEHLQKNEPEAFDLKSWVSAQSNKFLQEWPKRYKRKEKLDCGTAACLVGHLPLIFPKHWEWSGATQVVRPLRPDSHHRNLAEFFGLDADFWKKTIYSEFYRAPLLEVVLRRLHAASKLKTELELCQLTSNFGYYYDNEYTR